MYYSVECGDDVNYYLKEIREEAKKAPGKKNAMSKARDDAERIFSGFGMKPLCMETHELERENGRGIGKWMWHYRICKELRLLLAPLKRGDVVFIQFPIFAHCLFLTNICNECTKRGIRITLLLHDIETIRYYRLRMPIQKRVRVFLEETLVMKSCSAYIVHNENMLKTLQSLGCPAEKMVPLGIFDYIIDSESGIGFCRPEKGEGVVIAGNLSKVKCPYLGELPDNTHWNLYGTGDRVPDKANVSYKGAYSPEELITHLEGSFGLVWDGTSANTCAGTYGDYMKINNPHKTSLYLAAGLPVIIWKEAALAPFIVENGLGFSVSSLDEIRGRIDALTDEQYNQMIENVRKVGQNLRDGCFLRSAIEQALN